MTFSAIGIYFPSDIDQIDDQRLASVIWLNCIGETIEHWTVVIKLVSFVNGIFLWNDE